MFEATSFGDAGEDQGFRHAGFGGWNSVVRDGGETGDENLRLREGQYGNWQVGFWKHSAAVRRMSHVTKLLDPL